MYNRVQEMNHSQPRAHAVGTMTQIYGNPVLYAMRGDASTLRVGRYFQIQTRGILHSYDGGNGAVENASPFEWSQHSSSHGFWGSSFVQTVS